MKLFRFCSMGEVQSAMSGNRLVNTTDHHKVNKSRTDAVGFCWFDTDTISIPDAAMTLVGVATMEFLLIIDIDDDDPEKHGFKKGKGTFYDHSWEKGKTPDEILEGIQKEMVDIAMGRKLSDDVSMTIREWSTTSYMLKDFDGWELRVLDIPSVDENDPGEVVSYKPWENGGFHLIRHRKEMGEKTVEGAAPSDEIAMAMTLAHFTYSMVDAVAKERRASDIEEITGEVKERIDKEVMDAIKQASERRGKNGEKARK